MAEKRRQVTIKMTTEQEEAVKALFAYNDWDYDSEGKDRCMFYLKSIEFIFIENPSNLIY